MGVGVSPGPDVKTMRDADSEDILAPSKTAQVHSVPVLIKSNCTV